MSEGRQARVENLKESSTRKSEEAQAKAWRAIMALVARGATVDFPAVVIEAGVSPSFLYKNPRLRAEIVSRRTPPPPRIESRSTVARSKEASNAVKLAVASSALRQLRDENTSLRAENARLQGEIQTLRRSLRLAKL
ncbi:DUF6262 family protein [Microbacterium paludicola]|uniref:DUF6262 family protein n=1 Tax=Microbacterium paludicola TaxID=300019 RepID=UPI00119EB31C|nr:DUF6262 family protein [Microbacterium paludicola]